MEVNEFDRLALRGAHQFVRDDNVDEEHKSDWKVRLARKYYDQLYKEFAIADLSRCLPIDATASKGSGGGIGLRWRTESEVVSGKGQLTCGERRCQTKDGLTTLEVPFRYTEHGNTLTELVKIRLCPKCNDILKASQPASKSQTKDSREHKKKKKHKKRSSRQRSEESEGDGDSDSSSKSERDRKKHRKCSHETK